MTTNKHQNNKGIYWVPWTFWFTGLLSGRGASQLSEMQIGSIVLVLWIGLFVALGFVCATVGRRLENLRDN